MPTAAHRRMNDESIALRNNASSLVYELQELGRLLTARPEDESLWDGLFERMLALFGDASFFIGVYNRDHGTLHIPIAFEDGIRQPYEPIPLCGFSRAVIQRGVELHFPDVESEPERLIALNIVPDSLEPCGWSRSWIGVPLRGPDREILGLISVSSPEPDYFVDHDRMVAGLIAAQLSLGLDNLRIAAQDRERRHLLTALMDAGQVVAAAEAPDEALDHILELLGRLVGADASALLLPDGDSAEGERFQLYYSSDPENYPSGRIIKFNVRNPLRQAFIAQQPVIVPDSQRHSGWDGFAGLPGDHALQSWLGLPMTVRDQVIGLIVVGVSEAHHYSDAHASIGLALARQAAVAVDSARARMSYETSLDIQIRRARRLDLIHRIGSMIAASLDPQQVLNTTAQLLTELFEVDHCGIMMLERHGFDAHVVAEYPDWGLLGSTMTLENNESMRRLREGGLAYAVDERDIETLDTPTREILETTGARAALFAPLIAGEEFLGSIGLDSVNRPRVFTDEERETVMTIAGQVAMAIRNATLYEEAITANRLKNEFLANISHELRTPLNAIIGYGDMLQEQFYGALNEQQIDRVQRISTSGRHLLVLINDVLDFSRLEAGQVLPAPRVIQVADVATEVLKSLTPRAEAKGLATAVEAPQDELAAYADPNMTFRVLSNLIDNAIKFTEYGSVVLKVRPERLVNGISDSGLRPPARLNVADGNWIAVTVRDTGIGIRPEDQDVIFDSFRQADGSSVREYGGTGLGLAITRKLAALQGGYLWVDSEPGQGSAFTLLLPPAPFIGDLPVEGDPRALLLAVDDDPSALQLIRDYLGETEFQILGVTESAQALELARRYHPALIVSDVLMPGMTGLEMAAALRGDPRTSDIPIVLLSVADHRMQAAYLNITDYLVKPVTREALVEQVRLALERSAMPGIETV